MYIMREDTLPGESLGSIQPASFKHCVRIATNPCADFGRGAFGSGVAEVGATTGIAQNAAVLKSKTGEAGTSAWDAGFVSHSPHHEQSGGIIPAGPFWTIPDHAPAHAGPFWTRPDQAPETPADYWRVVFYLAIYAAGSYGVPARQPLIRMNYWRAGRGEMRRNK